MSDPGAAPSAKNARASSSRRTELLRVVFLVVALALIWCVANNRTSPWKWNIPLTYHGDGWLVMSWAKDAMEGHYLPVLTKNNPSLGAPFTANWNDYPVTEDSLVFFMACLAKILGLFAGCNLAVLIGEILAGVSFYLTARWLRVAWEWAATGAIIFTFSTYASFRSMGHITLSYYWHIPLCILVCWWLISRRGIDFRSRRFWFALGVGFVTGIQNPYYTNLFLQFTGFAFLAHLIRRSPREKLIAPLAVGAVAMAAFLLMNLDTLYYNAVNGKNPAAVGRNYAALEVYALKPVEMLVPSSYHSLPFMAKMGVKYAEQTSNPSETSKSSYLGVIGIFALFWLVWITISRVLAQPARPVPGRMLQILWIIVYSVVGGWNCLLGLLGLQLFRGTNRFSIWILALLLLFLVQRLTRIGRAWSPARRTWTALLLCALAIVDQVPRIQNTASLEAARAMIESDRGIVDRLTRALPAQSMVFQLPVADFPEAGLVGNMQDYEHLRPYLFSHQLRYSYGNDKGRELDTWQHETGDLKPAEMVSRLETAGFGAIWINRKGYADNGKIMIDGLRDAGRGETIESAGGDMLCVLLHPSASPVLPNPLLGFASGWYAPENNPADGTKERWTDGKATINVLNTSPVPASFRITFDVSSPIPRKLTLTDRTHTILETDIGPASKKISDLVVELKSGRTQLLFKIDPPSAKVPGSADPRKLGFLLKDISIQPKAP